MVVACLLLSVSGGVRFWREWQFRNLRAATAVSPFRLENLPKSLGSWRFVAATQLDEEVARIAGSSAHIVWEYLDEKGGERVSALILYGPATHVFSHTPDFCYPANGYRLVMGPEDRELSIPGVTTPVRCRWAIYAKRIGGIERYTMAYYTFLHNGQWLPDLMSRWKSFRYHPGVFKLQLERTISGVSPGDPPTEALLSELVREISGRMSPDPIREANQERPAQAAPSATQVQRDGKSG